MGEAKMPARHIIMNQCPFPEKSDGKNVLSEVQAAVERLEGASAEDKRLFKVLLQTLDRLQKQHQDAQKQIELLKHQAGPQVSILCVPTFEEELTGVASLKQYAQVLFDG